MQKVLESPGILKVSKSTNADILHLKSTQALKTAEGHLFFAYNVRRVNQFYQLILDSTFHISQTLFIWGLWVMSDMIKISASKVLLAFL